MVGARAGDVTLGIGGVSMRGTRGVRLVGHRVSGVAVVVGGVSARVAGVVKTGLVEEARRVRAGLAGERLAGARGLEEGFVEIGGVIEGVFTPSDLSEMDDWILCVGIG